MKTSRVFEFFSLVLLLPLSLYHSHSMFLFLSCGSVPSLFIFVYRLCGKFDAQLLTNRISFYFSDRLLFFFFFRSLYLAPSHSILVRAVSFYLEFDALSEIWQWNLSPINGNLVHWMSDCVYRLFNGNFFIVWHEKPTIWTWMTVWPSILLKPLCLFYHAKALLYIQQHIANAIVSMVQLFITVTQKDACFPFRHNFRVQIVRNR